MKQNGKKKKKKKKILKKKKKKKNLCKQNAYLKFCVARLYIFEVYFQRFQKAMDVVSKVGPMPFLCTLE